MMIRHRAALQHDAVNPVSALANYDARADRAAHQVPGLRYAQRSPGSDRRSVGTPEGRGHVAYFVAIFQEAWPDHLEDLLGTIRHSLASAPSLHPGRRTTRMFQRFGQPTQLLSISEWSDEHAFEQFKQWSVFVETNSVSGPPPRIEPLVPLRRFER